MKVEKYNFEYSDLFLDYSFESIGQNGKILKVVSFAPNNVNGRTFFNLGFGDVNSVTGKIDDFAVSDNGDTEKILATVAATVIEFISHFPDMSVYAKGSTPARTRLYQMGIAANWEEIDQILDVFGFVDGSWQVFIKNVNYEAFYVRLKKP